MKVLALVNGRRVEVELTNSCCEVKFVILTEPGGRPRAVDPRAVEQVQFQTFTRSRVRCKNTPTFTALGDVASIVAILEAA